MAIRKEMLTVTEKIARKKRKNPNLDCVEELRKYHHLFKKEEGIELVGTLNQIMLVCFYLKKCFPNGIINRNFALKKLGYDKDYFAFNIAVSIINDEEEGKPMSIYISFKKNEENYSEIDYRKFYK